MKYAVFILSHGRPHYQLTLDTLIRCGYSGDWYIVVDNLDKTVQEYKDLYGEHILVFDKLEYVRRTECGLAEPKINFAVFARNAIEDLAVQLGYQYFIMMDDDLTKFRYRYDDDGHFRSLTITDNLDEVFNSYVEYLHTANVACLCFGVHNNYMRGTDMLYIESPRLRLCFTVYFRNTSFKVDWLLNMCEDRITSIAHGRDGQVWLQLLQVQVDTVPIGGEVEGGNSEVYRSVDKFQQTFFPVVIFPDCNYCTMWKGKWITSLHLENVCPKIIGGEYKK